MVAVINVGAYPFLLFSDLSATLRIQKQVFSGCTVLPDSKENTLGSSNQVPSP